MKRSLQFWIIIFTLTLAGCKSESPSNEQTEDHARDTTSATAAPEAKVAETVLKYETYCNARFGFCVDYPSDLLIPQGEPANGDGQIFESKDAQNAMYAYWDFYPEDGDPLKAKYEENSQDRNNITVTRKKLAQDYFVVSGHTGDKIYYQKSIVADDGQVATCRLEYREEDKKIFDKVCERMFQSFKP